MARSYASPVPGSQAIEYRSLLFLHLGKQYSSYPYIPVLTMQFSPDGDVEGHSFLWYHSQRFREHGRGTDCPSALHEKEESGGA